MQYALQLYAVIQEKLEKIDAERERLAKGRGTRMASLGRERPGEKIGDSIAKLDESINTAKLQTADREAGKALSV